MAGRGRYTEGQKASAFVALAANDGNIKRTARETGLPENTLRAWRNEWRDTGSTPAYEEVEAAATDFLNEAVETRDLALLQLKAKIPDAKPGELVNIIGMLDDKITRAKGLANSRVEHVHTLPSAEEVREALDGFVMAARDAAIQRHADVIDTDLIESKPRALPSGR